MVIRNIVEEFIKMQLKKEEETLYNELKKEQIKSIIDKIKIEE